jgi:hypothetical protein
MVDVIKKNGGFVLEIWSIWFASLIGMELNPSNIHGQSFSNEYKKEAIDCVLIGGENNH